MLKIQLLSKKFELDIFGMIKAQMIPKIPQKKKTPKAEKISSFRVALL
jgi:hypothetical protein